MFVRAEGFFYFFCIIGGFGCCCGRRRSAERGSPLLNNVFFLYAVAGTWSWTWTWTCASHLFTNLIYEYYKRIRAAPALNHPPNNIAFSGLFFCYYFSPRNVSGIFSYNYFFSFLFFNFFTPLNNLKSRWRICGGAARRGGPLLDQSLIAGTVAEVQTSHIPAIALFLYCLAARNAAPSAYRL